MSVTCRKREKMGKDAYLHDEVKAAAVIVVGDGGVAAGDGLAVDFGANRNVLANGEAEHVADIRECEAVAV